MAERGLNKMGEDRLGPEVYPRDSQPPLFLDLVHLHPSMLIYASHITGAGLNWCCLRLTTREGGNVPLLQGEIQWDAAKSRGMQCSLYWCCCNAMQGWAVTS